MVGFTPHVSFNSPVVMVFHTSIVTSDVTQGPGCSLFDPGVKLLQRNDESLQSPTIHHCLGQLWRVPGHGAQDEGGCLFVKPLWTKRVGAREERVGFTQGAYSVQTDDRGLPKKVEERPVCQNLPFQTVESIVPLRRICKSGIIGSCRVKESRET